MVVNRARAVHGCERCCGIHRWAECGPMKKWRSNCASEKSGSVSKSCSPWELRQSQTWLVRLMHAGGGIGDGRRAGRFSDSKRAAIRSDKGCLREEQGFYCRRGGGTQAEGRAIIGMQRANASMLACSECGWPDGGSHGM